MNTRLVINTLLTATLLSAVSCKNFLEQPVLGQYDAAGFFTNDTNARQAVNACYVPLSFRDPASNVIWVLADVSSDDAEKGSNPGDQADFETVQSFNITPINAAVEAQWRRDYDGVFRCNAVVDGLPATNTNVSATVLNQSVGEAKFLRAWYYFQLTTLYGDIPLHLKVETPEELQSPVVKQAQIFAQVEADCQDAAKQLPDSWSGADVGRATKGAALALLAKTYLYEQKWPEAAQTAQLVTAQAYSLVPVYADNFRLATETNSEVIFAALHVSNLSPSQGNALNQWFAPRPQNGYGFYNPTQRLVDSYEKSAAGVPDPRLDYTIARTGHDYFGVTYDSTWSNTGYLSKKHIQPLSEVPTSIKGDGGLNFQAIRYAEVLLIEAEALNESGQSAAALAPLNQVRKRARESYLYDTALGGTAAGGGTVPDGLLPDITTTDQNALRDLIRQERHVELATEFQRFFDIIRYGEAYATQTLGYKANFNYAKNKFFPIPQSERDTNKKLGI